MAITAGFVSRTTRFARTAVTLLLVPLAVLTVMLLFLTLSDRSIPYSSAVAVLRLITTMLAALIALALILGFLWLLRAAYRALSTVHAPPLGILIGLGLAAVLSPRGVYALLVYPPWYTIRAARHLFDVAFPLSSQPVIGSVAGAAILDNMGAVLWGFATGLLDTAKEFWDELPILAVLVALMLWALVASLLSSVADGQGSRQSRFRTWWDGLDDRGRALAGVFVALMAGTYLSVAAIIAIPWLEGDDKETQGLSRENLQQQLLRSDTILTRAGVSLAGDSVVFLNSTSLLQALADTGFRRATALSRPADKDRWQRFFQRSKALVDKATVGRRTFLSVVDRRREALHKSLKENIDRAVGTYTTNASQQMTSAERVVYFQGLVDWARDAANATLSNLDLLADIVSAEETNAATWMNDVRAQLQEALVVVGQWPQDTTGSPGPEDFARRVEGMPPPFSREMHLPNTTLVTNLPSPPEPGSAWGPFGTVARWLLRARAVSLAQIAGMLGFGLFGAAISLLRWRDQKTVGGVTADAGIGDVPSVLLNGFSATMVIFLGVKGGLAVFTQGQTDPNSYVLFFACLVGAVFSQDVWKWARDRLAKTLAGTGSPSGSAAAPVAGAQAPSTPQGA